MPFRIPGDPWWIGGVAALGLVAAAVLVWQAWRSPQRRLIRAACSLGAVGMLVLIGLEPEWRTQQATEAAVLATPGASADRVAALADSLDTPIFALPGAALPEDGERVPDAAFIARNRPEIGTIHVAGYGLWPHEAQALRGRAVAAHLEEPQPGITSIYAPPTAVVGQPWRIQGQLKSEAAGGWLYLDSPAGPVDSVAVDSVRMRFSLSDAPREAGRVRYALARIGAEGDTLMQTAWGVDARRAPPPRVLVLQGAPQFETRYLKNWLAETGGELAVRSAISRGRVRTEFVNRPDINLAPLTARALADFDVLLLDARALEDLRAAEQRALRTAVMERGLGVLLGPDAVAEAASLPFELPLDWRPVGRDPRTTRVSWPSAPEAPALAVVPFALEVGLGGRVLAQDAAGRTVAAMGRVGAGRLGAHLPQATYRWRLQGATAAYAAYWSHVLGALAGRDAAGVWQVASDGPLLMHMPTRLAVQTARPRPVGLVAVAGGAEADTLFLAQDAADPQRWRGTFWPRRPGWHEVRLDGREEGAASDTLAFYVHEAEAWPSWQQARRAEATRRLAQASKTRPSVARVRYEPLPLWWFFAGFLLCAAVLWAERRW